jgi:hypothetical protein
MRLSAAAILLVFLALHLLRIEDPKDLPPLRMPEYSQAAAPSATEQNSVLSHEVRVALRTAPSHTAPPTTQRLASAHRR